MKRKMVNIMTTMLLISNISMNTVYASPIHLEPVPAPDMSITTEAENNSETTEETNGHNTLDMPDSNDGFHDGSEDVNHDGNEGYGLLEEIGGGIEETSSYINLGILQLDSFLVKTTDGDYVLNDHYAKIDEIINYAKEKTKIKHFNFNTNENISNLLNKTLRGIEYDEEKNMFYMDLEKNDRDYDSTYSKKNRTNDEKLYRVYFKLNYVYDGKRTDDVDFNYIINDIKSKNEDEIDDIKLVDDEFYGESGYNYLNVEITDKNGNKYKSKIIIETDQNQDYDQFGNINYDKPILTEEEIKNGQISNEHYNEIRDFIKYKDVFKPKNKFYIRNSVLNLDNNYRYYVSLTDGQYSKNFYLKTVENEEKNIDLNNLVIDDEVHYLQDINSIINDPIFGYDTLRVKTIIDNGQKYNLISAENNLLPLGSFIYRKYPNEKIVNVDKKEKDNDIYLIFNLTNNKQYVLKLNKIIIPNIKLNIDNNYLSSQNQDDIKKTIKYFYKNQIENFQNFTLFKENGQTKVKVKFEYSNYQSNNFDKYLIVNVNNPDNETVELFDPSTIQDKQEHLYNINIKYNPNIDEINEKGFYDAGTVEIDKNLDARIYKEYEGAGPSIGGDTDIQIIESLKQKLNTVDKITPTNWQDGYLKYDKDKQKFYQEYSISSENNENGKTYRFYFIGTDKNYEFSDEHDTKLDLTDEKNIDVVLAFIKEEYDNVKDIKLNNKNILTENNRNYLDVNVTEDDGTERDAKIFLKPTIINDTYNYKNINIHIDISSEEISNMKLSKETINKVNNILNKKINNNILYKDEYFVINDYNIYKNEYSPIESYYINIYDVKNKKNEKIKISINDDLIADLLLEDKNNDFNINDLKISEYKCNEYHKNNIYLSKNGEIPILDYINSKLSDGLYADNLRLQISFPYNKIFADIKDKNTHEKKSNFIINYNSFNNDETKSFFMNNVNDDLILTEKNKKDLEKLIRNTENVNIKNIEFKENFEKETKNIDGKIINYYIINATIYFENNYSEIKTYNVLVDSNYQDKFVVDALNGFVKPGIPQPGCGYAPSIPRYISPPTYGGKTSNKKKTEVKIKIPSADDFPDITPCNPNKPNEDVPHHPTPNEIVPKEPNEDAPHTPTPSNLPKISSPSPKTSNPPTVTERTPIVIIEKTPNVNDETRNKENADINNSENTDGLPNIERTPVKTNDYLFSIISVFGMIGIFACFINLMKNKHRNKLI